MTPWKNCLSAWSNRQLIVISPLSWQMSLVLTVCRTNLGQVILSDLVSVNFFCLRCDPCTKLFIVGNYLLSKGASHVLNVVFFQTNSDTTDVRLEVVGFNSEFLQQFHICWFRLQYVCFVYRTIGGVQDVKNRNRSHSVCMYCGFRWIG